jgi:peptide methionine sulfoxide reductase MsrA
MSENSNQHRSVHSGPRREVAVLAGGCLWGFEDLLRDDTTTVCAAAAALTERGCLSYQSNRSKSIGGTNEDV